VFVVLAAVHLTVLPPLLDAPGHDRMVLVAGVAYLGLAALDRWTPRRAIGRQAARGVRRTRP
jgi:hypothetical protein